MTTPVKVILANPRGFCAGVDRAIEIVDRALELYPEQHFGLHDPEKLHRMDRSEFGAGIALQPGVIVGFDTPAGEELSGTVVSLDEATVEVDFNHPLAGRTVIFDVEIIDVVPADADD
jgi:FKBP-type peptidyl-prolyl cis-trans isomerase SlpA